MQGTGRDPQVSKSPTGLSVLAAVYAGDRPEWLQESLRSLVVQTRPANEVVIVCDGPISNALASTIDSFRTTLPLKIVQLKENVGLGPALHTGLEHCSYQLVARMDADDICHVDRFKVQLDVLENRKDLDLLGSWIGEFESENPQRTYSIRHVPQTHEEIVRFARRRNPFNHMTVVFKKSIVEKVGGYRPVRGLEDYDLWMRMLISGARARNIPEVLVWARAGGSLAERRAGWSYFRGEFALLSSFYRSGFISMRDLLIGTGVRAAVRLSPRIFRRWAYRALLR